MSKLKTDSNGFPSEIPFKISEAEEKELGYTAIHAQIRFLMGKVLTIIDACIEDKQRNKAIKDLIRNTFADKLDWIYQLCGLPELKECNSFDPINDNAPIISQEVTNK